MHVANIENGAGAAFHLRVCKLYGLCAKWHGDSFLIWENVLVEFFHFAGYANEPGDVRQK
jgi:hypothetical protein